MSSAPPKLIAMETVSTESNEYIKDHRGLRTNKQTNNRRQSKTAPSQTNRHKTILRVCPVLKPGYVDYQNRRPHQNNDAASVDAGIVGTVEVTETPKCRLLD